MSSSSDLTPGGMCIAGTGVSAIGLAVFAIGATGVLVAGLGLGGIVSIKTVSIVSIILHPENPVTLVLGILGLVGKVGMAPVAGVTLAFSAVPTLVGASLLAGGSCCYCIAGGMKAKNG